MTGRIRRTLRRVYVHPVLCAVGSVLCMLSGLVGTGADGVTTAQVVLLVLGLAAVTAGIRIHPHPINTPEK